MYSVWSFLSELYPWYALCFYFQYLLSWVSCYFCAGICICEHGTETRPVNHLQRFYYYCTISFSLYDKHFILCQHSATAETNCRMIRKSACWNKLWKREGRDRVLLPTRVCLAWESIEWLCGLWNDDAQTLPPPPTLKNNGLKRGVAEREGKARTHSQTRLSPRRTRASQLATPASSAVAPRMNFFFNVRGSVARQIAAEDRAAPGR